MINRDQELLNLIKSDDTKAFDELVEKYLRRVYHFVSKVFHDTHLVNSVVTSIFKDLWNRRHEHHAEVLEKYIFDLTCKEIFKVIKAGEQRKSNWLFTLIKKGTESFRLYFNKMARTFQFQTGT